ncbi:malto-oligosyltrehalose synthase [Gordonia sp. NB41Y]|uniref:malto-oligosyltrehalose synthase n=1 Tax=Gordonia sp. NB41Y TaxID=875808 RepID=UPI0006B233EF|nr:malto-oligosyltrehalose synthase [Gordonia sp. NB41Y]EMP10753.2 maltooligosyl trehalose synthase [Gordonia sp. NB41Y]WLP90433.1 malto-oligosyltrehalose synthase [Gordonia sp. NB41Y]
MTIRPEPIATYRVQLTPDFGFADVIDTLDHIAALGVSHIYLSPIGTAMPGSTHGYDWVPPPGVASALGGRDGLRVLRSAARERGLGLVIDIVPNHTGVAEVLRNPWFADLLQHGPGSRYAAFFDADFSLDNGCDGALALPVLASDGDLGPLTVDTRGVLRYHDHAFPTAPGTLGGTPQEVHARQHYRLVPWDSGMIGYRRFFTIDQLAGLRQEDPTVYDATHAWLRDLVEADLIDGVRVDHPDGLWDPVDYLGRLRGDLGTDRLLWIEKILAADEPLEPALPVDGTTGYDQMRIIDALFTAPSGIVELSEIHEHTTGIPGDAGWLRDSEHNRKLSTLTEMFPAEHRRLVRAVTHSDPSADIAAVTAATAELIAGLGVYRADYPSLRPRLEATAARIAERRPDLADALATIVTATTNPGSAATARLAQTCGAVTAKSVEDSLFYRTARLVSAQEVGSDPADPTLPLRDFHAHNVVRAADWPRAMTAASTHDTKRGEDVRARIALLAQVPERWSQLVRQVWAAAPPPDHLTGYFLLQNVIGVWPVDSGRPVAVDDALRERLCAYARKAARESGLRTSWTDVDTEFEAALDAWVHTLTTAPVSTPIDAFVARIASAWEQEALARKAIGLLGPGVPDIYQGTEWFEDSLVDPDNRRPVDYDRSVDHPKTRLVAAALGVRATHPEAFGPGGDYRPIHADGSAADHIIAFARGVDGEPPSVVMITARFTHSLLEADAAATTVTLPPGSWVDLLDDNTHSGTVDVATLRAHHPVAVLRRA